MQAANSGNQARRNNSFFIRENKQVSSNTNHKEIHKEEYFCMIMYVQDDYDLKKDSRTRLMVKKRA